MATMNRHQLHTSRVPPEHLIFGCGGSKAILGGCGAVLALRLSGLNHWKTIGGVSGGSIPAALYARGLDSKTLLQLAIQTDFSSLLTPRRGKLGQLWALINKFKYEVTLPTKGVFSSHKLANFIDIAVSDWPNQLWTVAAAGSDQIMFCADGAFRYGKDGSVEVLATEPPTVGLAVTATCAVPGVLDAVPYQGLHLFDGALSGDGQTPVEPIRRQFNANYNQILAFDVGEDDIKNSSVMRAVWHLMCGGKCSDLEGEHPEEEDGLIVIEPLITGFHALQFNLELHHKWRAVLTSFSATMHRLVLAGLLCGPQHKDAFELTNEFDKLLRAKVKKHEFTERAEGLLQERNLF